jgi:molybdate transport system substrate-binding protein
VKRAPALVASLAALTLVPAAGSRPEARLTVLAAASLTQVLPKIDAGPAYSFAGSDQLAFQIEQGAPADVFASASPTYTRTLFAKGLVEMPRAFASNSLVLAVPRSNPAHLQTVFDLARRPSLRLVIGDAKVPIGAYTRQVLARLGLTRVLSKVVSKEPDVESIVGKLAVREADAGFVYRTDVRAARSTLRAIAIPRRGQPSVRYEAAVVKASAHRPAARRWVRSLATAKRARSLLTKGGFGKP